MRNDVRFRNAFMVSMICLKKEIYVIKVFLFVYLVVLLLPLVIFNITSPSI